MKVINEKKSFAAIAMRGPGGSNNNNANGAGSSCSCG
jgi:hypothetical protein